MFSGFAASVEASVGGGSQIVATALSMSEEAVVDMGFETWKDFFSDRGDDKCPGCLEVRDARPAFDFVILPQVAFATCSSHLQNRTGNYARAP